MTGLIMCVCLLKVCCSFQQAGAAAPLGAEGGVPLDYRRDVEQATPAFSGRAAHREAVREPHPGIAEDVPRVPVEEMAQMAVGTREASAAGERRAQYSDLNTRPAHIIDKKGIAECTSINN